MSLTDDNRYYQGLPVPLGAPVLQRWPAIGLVVPLTALFLLIVAVVGSVGI